MDDGRGQENQQVICCSVCCIASNLTLDVTMGRVKSSVDTKLTYPEGSLQKYESLADRPANYLTTNSYLVLIQENWSIWFQNQDRVQSVDSPFGQAEETHQTRRILQEE